MNIKGWDSVCLIGMRSVNEILADTWDESRSAFCVEDEEYIISATFGTWSFIQGGGGRLFRMKLPLRRGVINLTERGRKYDFSGSWAVLDIMLNFFGDERSKEFAFDFSRFVRKPEEIEPQKDGYVLPIAMNGMPKEAEPYRQLILEEICCYLIRHPEQLRYVLAQVNLAYGRGESWMEPVRCCYSVLDGKEPYLGILSVCTERETAGLPLDVDVSGLRLTGGKSFLVLSPILIYDNVIRQVMMHRFHSFPENYYYNGVVMTNNTRLYMPAITVGAIDYHPSLYERGLEAYIAGSRLFLNLQGDCELYMGITMTWQCNFSADVIWGAAEQIIVFRKQTFNFTHNVDIPWYLRFIPLSFIIDIIVFVISESLSNGIQIVGDISGTAISAVQWGNVRQVIEQAELYDSLILTCENCEAQGSDI